MNGFLIYALPRSRTYWLSRYLTYGDWQCGHDELVHARSMADVKSWLSQPATGTIETLAAPFWRLAKDIKSVVIRRPVDEVLHSLANQGFRIDQPMISHIKRLDAKLDQIEHRVPNVMSVEFKSLTSEDIIKQIFEYCLPYQHDPVWYNSMRDLNLQINMNHVRRYVQAYWPQLEKLAKIAKHESIKQINNDVIVFDPDDGMIIQEEPFDKWLKDARPIMSNHLVAVGESPDEDKNWQLLQTMHDMDAMQVVTARCNGRMFGYHVFILAPSMEKEDRKVAVQTTFYAEQGFKNLGMKMQRASLDLLKLKGMDEIHYPAGKRGSGPRLGTLYRRLGAELLSETYRLSLNI